MCGIKTPQQDFVVNMQGGGGAYARGGGIFVGHYGTRHMHVHHVPHVEHAST